MAPDRVSSPNGFHVAGCRSDSEPGGELVIYFWWPSSGPGGSFELRSTEVANKEHNTPKHCRAFFMHVPGIKVVMPSTAHDAKGLSNRRSSDGNPVMYIDDRWLYEESSEVPEEMYEVPIGLAAIRRSGADVSIVATSFMTMQGRSSCKAS